MWEGREGGEKSEGRGRRKGGGMGGRREKGGGKEGGRRKGGGGGKKEWWGGEAELGMSEYTIANALSLFTGCQQSQAVSTFPAKSWQDNCFS